jgi:hypothetical protein
VSARRRKLRQPALVRLGGLERRFIEQLEEEALGKVLRIMLRVTAPPEKRVDGIPIKAAQLLQRRLPDFPPCRTRVTSVQCVVGNSEPAEDTSSTGPVGALGDGILGRTLEGPAPRKDFSEQ